MRLRGQIQGLSEWPLPLIEGGGWLGVQGDLWEPDERRERNVGGGKEGGAGTGWDSLTGAGDLGRRQKDGLAAPLWD